MTTSSNSSIQTDALRSDEEDLNKLVYKFDSTWRWQYFLHGDPIVSSVQKSRKLVTSQRIGEQH